MKTALRLTIAVLSLAAFNLSAATLLVSLESTNPVAPFASWATAATNIQDAVDAAHDGDTVLVTNGVYAVGEREWFDFDEWGATGPSRVVVTNAIRLESVNGPEATAIHGGQSARCVYLVTNGVVSGFTLTQGYVSWTGGGGVYCAHNGMVTNCILTDNSAYRRHGGGAYGGTLCSCILSNNSALGYDLCTGVPFGYGGGASQCILSNCVLTANSAAARGGGAYDCTLYDCTMRGNSAVPWTWPAYGGAASHCTLYGCTLSGNSASEGGGAYLTTLHNCVVHGNSAWGSGGGASECALYNCLVTENASPWKGGGVASSMLYNCTLTGNSAEYGGGAAGGALYNCIVYYNTALDGANYSMGIIGGWDDVTTLLLHCCTSPLPTNGVGNITGPPLFMDLAVGNLRLREDSPSIDAGMNLLGFVGIDQWGFPVSYAYGPTDILGNTRFIDGNGDGTVAWDIGAYEFMSFKPPRFSVSPQLSADGWKLNITGAPEKWARLERSSDLQNWGEIWSGWMGTEGATQVTDNDQQGVMFYRVVVE